jgi:hypothetical protein
MSQFTPCEDVRIVSGFPESEIMPLKDAHENTNRETISQTIFHAENLTYKEINKYS